MTPNIIVQSNWPVWMAILSIRLERTPATMEELYDSLNRRREMRANGLNSLSNQ